MTRLLVSTRLIDRAAEMNTLPMSVSLAGGARLSRISVGNEKSA